MVNVRLNPDPASDAGGPCRLNLLLSYGGWRDESWADRLPRLLEPMGIRSIRADSGKQASAAIQSNPIHIAIVDLGLPLDQPFANPAPAAAPQAAPGAEEAGPRLLQLLARLSQPPPTVVVKRARTLRDDRREIVAALRAGAFAVIDRPTEPGDVEMLLEVLRRCLRRHYHNRWPGLT